MADVQTIARHIPDRLESRGARLIKSWETLLVAVALAIFLVNSFASPYFLDAWNLSDATFNFTEKALIAFAMALLIIAGEIDLSVAAIINCRGLNEEAPSGNLGPFCVLRRAPMTPLEILQIQLNS